MKRKIVILRWSFDELISSRIGTLAPVSSGLHSSWYIKRNILRNSKVLNRRINYDYDIRFTDGFTGNILISRRIGNFMCNFFLSIYIIEFLFLNFHLDSIFLWVIWYSFEQNLTESLWHKYNFSFQFRSNTFLKIFEILFVYRHESKQRRPDFKILWKRSINQSLV